MLSTSNKTKYSVYSDNHWFVEASIKVISSTTGQYFSIILCLPSNRWRVAVSPKINLYLSTL